MGDGDGVDPGITGLGNFKGVMLCNRPDATGSLQSQKSELKPFYSSVAPGALEPLGMLTKKDPSDQPPPRRREEAPALKRHREWIKQLQEEMKEAKKTSGEKDLVEKARFLATRETAAEQRAVVKKVLASASGRDGPEFINELRQAVKGSMEPKIISREEVLALDKNAATSSSEERKKSSAGDGDGPVGEDVGRTKPGAPAETAGAAAAEADGGAAVEEDKAEQGRSAEGKKPAKKKKKRKPLWAMSEREKAEAEEEDMGDLVEFASELDYEKFLEDMEFRDVLAILKGRANVLSKEEAGFMKDLEKAAQDLEEEDKKVRIEPEDDAISGVSLSVSQRGENLSDTDYAVTK